MTGLEGLLPTEGREEQGRREARKDILHSKEDVVHVPL